MATENDDVAAARSELEALLTVAREAASSASRDADAVRSVGAELKGVVTAAQTLTQQSSDAYSQITSLLEVSRAANAALSDVQARAEGSRAEVEQSAQLAASRSKHVEEGLAYVNAKRVECDELLASTQQAATSTNAELASARDLVLRISAAQTDAQSLRAAAEAEAGAVEAARKRAESDVEATKGLAGIAADVEKRVRAYEENLAQFRARAEAHEKKIETLLLGATNAGLASAFDARSKTFKIPKWGWQLAFLAALGGLLGLAYFEAKGLTDTVGAPAWDVLLRMLLHRLPFLIPLVWLALHAARQATLAMRMEEEYAFKATISTSFEGYRRQMAEIGSGLPPEHPLARLCADTLETISAPPGEVYDKHLPDPTPATAGIELAKPLVEAVAKLADKLPGAK